MAGEQVATAYSIPRYRAPAGAAFLHVLHGHVPGHQIDFMYAPEVPQRELTPTHFSHLARLMKYMEPQPGARYGFAIANLSRDDTQFEPGHGGLGLIFGLRIAGAIDHTGRKDPPFAHAIAGVNREFSRAALVDAASTLFRHIVGESEVEKVTTEFYPRYVAFVTEAPERVPDVLASYIASFADLPDVAKSQLDWAWRGKEGTETPRVLIAYDDEPFEVLAEVAARIAAVLYRSNIRWTQVTTGGERDLPGGVTVRLVMRRNLPADLHGGLLLDLGEVPIDDEAIAEVLFGATAAAEVKAQAQGWREKFAYQKPQDRDASGGEASRPPYATAPEAGERMTWVPEAITRVAALESADSAGPDKVPAAPASVPSSPPARGVHPSERSFESPAAHASGTAFAIAHNKAPADIPNFRSSAPSWPIELTQRSSSSVIDLVHKKAPGAGQASGHAAERSSESFNPYAPKPWRGLLWAGVGAACVLGIVAFVLFGGASDEDPSVGVAPPMTAVAGSGIAPAANTVPPPPASTGDPGGPSPAGVASGSRTPSLTPSSPPVASQKPPPGKPGGTRRTTGSGSIYKDPKPVF